LELSRRGILKQYGVTVLGTPIEGILATEDRGIFTQRLAEIGERTAPAEAASSVTAALEVCQPPVIMCCASLFLTSGIPLSKAAKRLGYPVLVRAGFALGGLGSGIAKGPEELRVIARGALQAGGGGSIQVDRSLHGWREFEYEVGALERLFLVLSLSVYLLPVFGLVQYWQGTVP